MPNDSNSSLHAPGSRGSIQDGPVPLPEESPFLSDHGLGEPAPPPVPQRPAVPPSEFSQFPANSVPPTGFAAATQSQAIPRALAQNPSSVVPLAANRAVDSESLSSFPLFQADGGTEDPFAAARGSQGAPRGAPSNDLMERLRSILLTTTDSLQGRLVEQYVGIVTAEAVVPTDALLEGAERTGRFSRYKTSQQKLKALQQLVLAELKLEAEKVGGNAVVGTQLRISVDHGIVAILASGTAVRFQ